MQQSTQTTPQLPTGFFEQLIARLFKSSTPKFFQILTTSFAVAGGLLALLENYSPEILTLGLVGQDFINKAIIVLKGYLYLSGVFAAQSAIKTPSTPPLASEIEKPTLESLAAEVAALKAQQQQPNTLPFTTEVIGDNVVLKTNEP